MQVLDFPCFGFSSLTWEKLISYVEEHRQYAISTKKTSKNGSVRSFKMHTSPNFRLQLSVEERVVDGKIEYVNFVPIAYVANPMTVMNPKWEKKERLLGSLRIEPTDLAYPLHMTVPSDRYMAKVRYSKRYICHMACYATRVELFSTEAEFQKQQVASKRDILFLQDSARGDVKESKYYINGDVQCVEEAVNPITGEEFYYIEVKCMENIIPVFASAYMAERIPETGDIISVYGELAGHLTKEAEGIGHHFKFNKCLTPLRFHATVVHVLSHLRALSYEHLVVEIDEMKVGNVRFIQTIKNGRKFYVEIGTEKDGKNYLFQSQGTSLNCAIRLFETILVKRLIPDISRWRDISNRF